MAEAGGAFVTRSFKRMLNDAPGRKYSALQTALKAYLERKPELPPPPAVHHEEAAAVADEIHVAATTAQETSSDGEPSTPKEEAEVKSMDNIIISPVLSPGKPSTGQAAAATLAEAGHTLEGSEADLVILPLLLAFETKQSRLIETALDCLHKLISYGHLEGEAGLERGKNGERVTKIVDLVCASADTTATDSVILQVVKVLLSAVASPTFQVHGESLFTAIWTCYNIFLSAKSPVNQATAKATLTQMISIVLKRMESEKRSRPTTSGEASSVSSSNGLVAEASSNGDNISHQERSDAEVGTILIDSETGEARNARTGETMEMPNSLLPSPRSSTPVAAPSISLYELHQLAVDADVKGFEAALEKVVSGHGVLKSNGGKDSQDLTVVEQDAHLVLQTLCKMAMKGGGGDDFQNRNKLLSLELLQNCLESVSYAFTFNFRFLDLIRAYICYILLRASVSSALPVFQLAVNVYMILLQRFRETLKVELGIFFSLLLLRSVDGSETSLNHRSAVLKILEKICNDPQMLADMFINYDCDPETVDVFERMVNSLSRLAQGTHNVDPNSAVFAQTTTINASSLRCLMSILKSLEIWTMKQRAKGVAAANASTDETLIPWASGGGGGANKPGLKDANATLQADELEIPKVNEVTLEAAVAEFNRIPMNGINFLEVHNLVPHDPKAVAQFLKDTPGLDRVMIGDYLGEEEEFTSSVMHAYVDSMSFSDMKFDKAIQAALLDIHLPRQPQKIDRIIEKFAERYYKHNPRLFKNADSVYVLAYAVITLKDDIQNPEIWPKPSKADFVQMNMSSDAVEQAPQELLEDIYDSVVQGEIVHDDEAKRDHVRSGEKHSLSSILNLHGARRRALKGAKEERDELVQSRQRTLVDRGGFKKEMFLTAESEDLAGSMLEAVGWPLLAAFSVTMEDSENKSAILLCMEGFRLGIQLTKMLGMDVMRYAFLTSLVRFTFLHAPREMKSKNVEALKMLLALCQDEPEALKDTWNAVLECLSRLEYLTSTLASSNILMLGGNQISRHSLLLSLTELAGNPTEQVFVNSAKLPSDAVVEFCTALCGVSRDELQQNPPRLFSLTKLIEISYYNLLRIRMVWGSIWAVLSPHFVTAGCQSDDEIAVYVINALQQLTIKCLERPELANFTFQERILKPFVLTMGMSKSPRIRALIVDSIIQLIKSKIGSLKSGWRSVFMVFTMAADDNVEAISDVAFESVEQVILEHQVLGDCFVDCVTCLIAFANNKISSRTSLKAIALLRICEDRLADGTVIQGSIQRDTANQVDGEIAEHYWFPMLAGLSDLTSDPRTEVRNCALEVLFDLLKVRGQSFSGSFWESVYHRVLFPIFDFVRSVSKDGEKPASQDQWIQDTCIHSLQLLCDLFSAFYKEVSFLLPSLLSLLLDCATRPDQTLASISMGALIRFTEIGGHQFDEKDWTTLLDSLRDACYTTQPVELLNPDSAIFLGSDYGLGPRKFGTTPISSFRGEQLPMGQYATDAGRVVEFSANGSSPARTPGSVSNGDGASLNHRLSFDSIADDRLERSSIAESEGSEAISSPKEGKRSVGGSSKNKATGRSFMGNMMDTLFMRNATLKSRGKTTEANLDDAYQDVDVHGVDGSELEGTLLQGLRSKCVIQLLLLGALDSLQKNHWMQLQTSHKRLIMDTILSMVDFAASYNSDSNLRSRFHLLSGDRPPPNLLRQETEGTQIYLTVLNQTASQGVSNGGETKYPNGSDKDGASKGEEEKLREESERRFVTFCGHILREVATLQPGPNEIVQAEAHRSLVLRSPVTVQVLNAMTSMDPQMFKKHLPEFYPYFTKLICSDQMDVRRALGDLFKVQLMGLLP